MPVEESVLSGVFDFSEVSTIAGGVTSKEVSGLKEVGLIWISV